VRQAHRESGAPEKERSLQKKDEGQPNNKTTLDADRSKAESREKAASTPSGYSRGESQKPVSKAYRDNWNAIYAKKKKKSGNWINGADIAVSPRA
jgi:hypothetical protein